jgi:hypothetical protein
LERGDPNGEQPTSDEDDDGEDDVENGQGYDRRNRVPKQRTASRAHSASTS